VVGSDPVLVTGGSGFVGRGIVERLVADGRSVRALARSDAAARDVSELGATPVRGDVLDATSLRSGVAGCTTVFHVAGVNATCARKPRPMLDTNVTGSANVIRAAAAEGVKRVVHTSSAAAIGEPAGAIGRESTPHRGWYLSNYERSKHLAERAVFRLGEETGVEVVSVNPSSVQGPGRSTGSARLIINVAGGKLPLLIDSVVSIVDVADCAHGHVLAEANGDPGERYILNGATIGTRDAVSLVDRLWGLPRRWTQPVGPSVATCRSAARRFEPSYTVTATTASGPNVSSACGTRRSRKRWSGRFRGTRREVWCRPARSATNRSLHRIASEPRNANGGSKR
jgi:dihydroflavonol-4-reductase